MKGNTLGNRKERKIIGQINGHVRRYLPKGTNLGKISYEEIAQIE